MNGNEEKLSGLALAERLWLSGALAAVSVLAWAYTIHMARHRGAGHVTAMPAGHGTHHMTMQSTAHAAAMPHLSAWNGAESWMTFVMWTVMMAAMMLPTAIPMVLAFSAVNRQHGGSAPLIPVGAFTAGYLGAWALFSAGATAAQWGLQSAALLSPVTLACGPVLGGLLLIVAGVFQWTPWKDACLAKCRNPLGFLLTHWRPGRVGALKLGYSYGLYCVGCCWLLMVLCFALGVMNLVWMAALTLFMLIEKITPAGRTISRAAGLGLAVWGGWMLYCII